MASSVDGMVLDNDDSRDGAGSVTSMTPAPSPAQTPSPPMPTQVEYRVAVFNERPRAKDVRVLKRA